MAMRINRRQFVQGSAALAVSAPALITAAEAEWGDLTGRLVFDGKPGEREKLVVDKDVDCCGKFDIRDETLIVGEDSGLANVYLFVRARITNICPELEEAVEEQVELDNRDCIFMPHCMNIWSKKQQLHIVNSDPVAQNVAFSPMLDVPANIVLAVDGEATHRFRRGQKSPVPIACNYHPWESAYILPRDDPYGAVTAEDGTFSMPKLPVGDWEFQVWQERVGPLATNDWPLGRMKLTIKPGVNDLGSVKIDPASLKKA